MNIAALNASTSRFSGRPSSQARAVNPGAAPPAQPRAAEMAEKMREILHRDGNVTADALAAEGYTAGEIVEHSGEASLILRATLSVDGMRADRVPEVIEKAILATAWIMPLVASTEDTPTLRLAWRDYCTANAAHRIDPWVSQSERCLVRLKVFLALLPILPREVNTIVQAVAAALKRRVQA